MMEAGRIRTGVIKSYRPSDGVYKVALTSSIDSSSCHNSNTGPTSTADTAATGAPHLGTVYVRGDALAPVVVGRINQPVLTQYGSGKLEQVGAAEQFVSWHWLGHCNECNVFTE
jgi:hypothetical protein